ncbi:phosphotransferase system enzyme I (PtsI) [Mycobacterium frederiksbergense]|uniref:Phosphoenolpyruvate-protein phosphotransferase n=1 Tax=Mycolicibacterium frederiksbergense TaxID=117567 RepID=A0ABT6KYL5_9MYCO|nr:putative PEP-binding protein [Mycolicibacterium frederiksbergense]MDH6195723.1 phosphotransferase system enzyme I (PtsI) [Mycolicibacterium frederiksbergense]
MTSTNPAAPPTVLRGVPVVAGVRCAQVIRPVRMPVSDGPAADLAETLRPAEAARCTAAAAAVAARLRERATRATGAAAQVLAAHATLAQDRAWLAAIDNRITAGAPAVRAVAEATQEFAEMLTKLGAPMAERVTDLYDIRDRVLAELCGISEPVVPQPDQPSILCARDLAPADAAELDPARIIGLATTLGGPTSHTAIIARELGIACVVAVAGLDEVPAGAMVLLDGSAGTITVGPDPAQIATAPAGHDAGAWIGPGATADGHPVALLANLQDAPAAGAGGAEGVGLLRTELCFLGRDVEPTVDEQAELYGRVLTAFAGRTVVIRTLDAGSDKPLGFVGHPVEPNPALGIRGIRTAWRHPGLLERQLEAVAVAARDTGQRPWVMAPMIATVDEAKSFAALARSLGLSPGVMVEVPAAALLADRILDHVDFLSVGTNDLAQYAMAADRMSADLSALTDPWQPAVLALVGMAARAGRAAGKPVGVCGEAAADPLLAAVLVGLGVTSLSMAPAAIPAVGAQLARVTEAQCRAAADAVLAATTSVGARAAARAAMGE